MAYRGPDARSVRRAVLTMAPAAPDAAPVAPTGRGVGPARGALLISGGGRTASRIIDRFIEPAGGPDAPIVVVPTSGRPDEDYHVFRPCPRRFREAGATNLAIAHTRDRAAADTEAFVEPRRRARGIWFDGGNHWLHADASLDTRVHEDLFSLLDRRGRGGIGRASSSGGDHECELIIRAGFLVADASARGLAARVSPIPRRDHRRGSPGREPAFRHDRIHEAGLRHARNRDRREHGDRGGRRTSSKSSERAT